MNGDRGWKNAIVSLQGGQKNGDQVSRAYITKPKSKWYNMPRQQRNTRQSVCPFQFLMPNLLALGITRKSQQNSTQLHKHAVLKMAHHKMKPKQKDNINTAIKSIILPFHSSWRPVHPKTTEHIVLTSVLTNSVSPSKK